MFKSILSIAAAVSPIAAFAAFGQPPMLAKHGIQLGRGTEAAASLAAPACVEVYTDESHIREMCRPYDRAATTREGLNGSVFIHLGLGARAEFQDRWTEQGAGWMLTRTVTVHGRAPGGFLSSIQASFANSPGRAAVQYFIPGIVYGGVAHLTPAAIGGNDIYGAGGNGILQVREDRTPAPLAGVYFPGKSSLTLLHTDPIGTTTVTDSKDTEGVTLIDRHFQFGAVGCGRMQVAFGWASGIPAPKAK